MNSSVLHVITSDCNTAKRLHFLFEMVKIDVLTYPNKDAFLNQKDPVAGCLLIDINSPEEHILEILMEIIQLRIFIPIIITTNNDDIQEAVKAMKLGALDFILKP